MAQLNREFMLNHAEDERIFGVSKPQKRKLTKVEREWLRETGSSIGSDGAFHYESSKEDLRQPRRIKQRKKKTK